MTFLPFRPKKNRITVLDKATVIRFLGSHFGNPAVLKLRTRGFPR